MNASDRTAVAAVILAIGLALGGWFVGNGFARGRSRCRMFRRCSSATSHPTDIISAFMSPMLRAVIA